MKIKKLFSKVILFFQRSRKGALHGCPRVANRSPRVMLLCWADPQIAPGILASDPCAKPKKNVGLGDFPKNRSGRPQDPGNLPRHHQQHSRTCFRSSGTPTVPRGPIPAPLELLRRPGATSTEPPRMDLEEAKIMDFQGFSENHKKS